MPVYLDFVSECKTDHDALIENTPSPIHSLFLRTVSKDVLFLTFS